MRISSSLLKSAVYLLLGASAVFGGAAAKALTFNWSWTATRGDDGNGADLTGTVVTGTIDNLADNTLNTTGMTATFLSGFNVGQTVLYTGGTGIQVTNGAVVTPGLQAYFLSNDNLYKLQLEDPNGISGTWGGFANDNDYDPDFNSGPYLFMDNGTAPIFSSASASAVPAPLQILGLPAVFFYSRKLRKRIKVSKEASGASLV